MVSLQGKRLLKLVLWIWIQVRDREFLINTKITLLKNSSNTSQSDNLHVKLAPLFAKIYELVILEHI